MTFWQEFVYTFSDIGWLPAILLVLGLIFVIVELFVPGYGFFGITGGILVIAALIIRAYNNGGGNPVIQAFVLLGVSILVLSIAAIVLLILVKKGVFSRTGFVLGRTSVSKDRSDGTPDFTCLIGETGTAKCDLRPVGTVEIGDKLYDVVTRGEYIVSGSGVKVIDVEGVRIIVVSDSAKAGEITATEYEESDKQQSQD